MFRVKLGLGLGYGLGLLTFENGLAPPPIRGTRSTAISPRATCETPKRIQRLTASIHKTERIVRGAALRFYSQSNFTARLILRGGGGEKGGGKRGIKISRSIQSCNKI